MVRIAGGDHAAFTDLVHRHTQNYFDLAFRTLRNQADAEDVVQTAFIKLWQNPSSWRSDKSRFTTWFYRVVLNACYDQLRKSKILVHASDVEMEPLLQPTECESVVLERQIDLRWRQNCLEVGVSKLPASQRDAINLVIYSHLPQQQAADVMGVSLKALESLLVRAKRSLKITVNKLCTEQYFSSHQLQRAAVDR